MPITVGITHKLPFSINVLFDDNSSRPAQAGDVVILSVVSEPTSGGNAGSIASGNDPFSGFYLPGEVNGSGHIHVEGTARDASGTDVWIAGDSDVVLWVAENPPPAKPTGFAVVFGDPVPVG